MRTTRRTEGPVALIINTTPGYPNPILKSRFLQDFTDAAAVKLLAWIVLGCETDGSLHFSERGTSIVLRPSTQAPLWGADMLDTAPLTDLIPIINRWMAERVAILHGKRAVESRIVKSDAALNELGYPGLLAALLKLAEREPRKLHVFDAAGGGGILDVPARADLVPVRKSEKPASPDDGEEILSLTDWTRTTDPAGTQREALTKDVSAGVIAGARARASGPRKTRVRARRAQHATATTPSQEKDDGKKE